MYSIWSKSPLLKLAHICRPGPNPVHVIAEPDLILYRILYTIKNCRPTLPEKITVLLYLGFKNTEILLIYLLLNLTTDTWHKNEVEILIQCII